MPVEKGKVLAAIETKFKGKSITKTFKENIAEKWAAKIDNDTDIDDFVNDREDVILEAVSEADRRATDAVKKAKANEPKPNDTNPEPPKDDVIEIPADTPEWAKALIAQNKTLADKVNGFEASQQQKSIAERFKTDERLKGIPEFVLKRAIPSKEEDFEESVTNLAAEYSTFAKEANLQSFGKDTPAGGGVGNPPANPKEATKEEIEAIVSGMKVG